MKHPRVFKEHSPVGLLKGEKPRIIQCTRNPLDAFVSAWHHSIGKDFVYYYNGNFAHFIKNVAIKGLFEGGDWFEFHEEYRVVFLKCRFWTKHPVVGSKKGHLRSSLGQNVPFEVILGHFGHFNDIFVEPPCTSKLKTPVKSTFYC